MNSVLRRVGLYSEAARSVVLLHVFAVVALVVAGVVALAVVEPRPPLRQFEITVPNEPFAR